MKKQRRLALFAACALITITFVVVQSCQKTSEIQEPAGSTIDDESIAVTQHILDFKAKMEYYRDNPDLKSGGTQYSADSACFELESLLNFSFCYTNIECNQKSFVNSDVVLPLDDLAKINDPNLMLVYYDKVIDTVQAQMGRINYSNMKLLLVDLNVTGYENNGDAIVDVGLLIGNEGNNSQYTDGWIYGENKGLCVAGWYNDEDAATQLDARVTDAMIPDPPSGARWYFVPLFNKFIPATQDRLNNPLDNDRDYKIFYANNYVAEITDQTKCLYGDDMNFYEDYYIDYAEDYETTTGKTFCSCIIIGDKLFDPLRIRHKYRLFVGNRFPEYTIGVGDILAVE